MLPEQITTGTFLFHDSRLVEVTWLDRRTGRLHYRFAASEQQQPFPLGRFARRCVARVRSVVIDRVGAAA